MTTQPDGAGKMMKARSMHPSRAPERTAAPDELAEESARIQRARETTPPRLPAAKFTLATYSARISHTTTAEQLAELESARTTAKASGQGAVSITSMLRAMTAICLNDPQLRSQVMQAARDEWR